MPREMRRVRRKWPGVYDGKRSEEQERGEDGMSRRPRPPPCEQDCRKQRQSKKGHCQKIEPPRNDHAPNTLARRRQHPAWNRREASTVPSPAPGKFVGSTELGELDEHEVGAWCQLNGSSCGQGSMRAAVVHDALAIQRQERRIIGGRREG